ncbi:MAG: hypothetical protein JWM05_2945 [Acidimicrobiales bacterium]|nr:hypothetical protein [Acidimicrobiales bacterium]
MTRHVPVALVSMAAAAMLTTAPAWRAPAGADPSPRRHAAASPAQVLAALRAGDRDRARDIDILRGSGLTDDQVLTMLQRPQSVAMSVTTTATSANVTVSDQPSPLSMPLPTGTFGRPTAARRAQCGWAITNHDGSAFARRTARLYLRTDWCWDRGAITGRPRSEHRSSVTLYGHAGGWRVRASYPGSLGWIGRDFRTEAKADWRLLACAIPGFHGCVEVQTGTAFARQQVTGAGRVAKTQGGWP